ncbi:MAG: glycosyltransferase family 4 protein [Burkholderiaceae bacterium]|nr:glycosyltransferase family 4 protein [Burkholderiaceae bacterium]
MTRSPGSPLAGKRVCVIQAVMKRYREPFYLRLRDLLASDGIELEVVYGPPWPQEALRGDNVDLSPPLGRRVPNWWLFGRVLMQPVLRPWMRADLVIVEHANKYALNYFLMLLDAAGIKRLAYWGHGRDRQTPEGTFGAWLRRRTLAWSHWWFAYTRGALEDVAAAGFPRDRITVVGNAIDTQALREQLASVGPTQVEAARQRLGWSEFDRVVVCCGSLHPNKHVDALIEASDAMHAADPRLRLLVIGGGPGLHRVQELAASRPWVRCVGPQFGSDLAVLLRLAELWLNPGLVGLGVLDAFCAGLPVITRDIDVHSPEVEYIEHGVNGLILGTDMAAYAGAVIELLHDDKRLRRMQRAAHDSAARRSIDAMAENFARGITACLSRR